MDDHGSSSVDPETVNPQHADLSPEDVQAMVQLYQKHPALWGAFKDISHLTHLLATKPHADQETKDSLYKTLIHFHTFSKDFEAVVHFAALSGYVEKGVSFARELLRSMGRTYLTEFPSSTSDMNMVCLHLLRGNILNCVYTSSEFSLRLIKTGYLQDLLEDIKHIQHLSVEALERGKVYLYSLGSIHNCCMYPEGAAAVRQLNVVPHVTPFLKKRGQNYLIHSIAAAVVAHVVEEDQLDLLALDARLLQYFLRNVEVALETRQSSHSGWCTRELLCDLHHLARNDFNKRLMVSQGTLNVLHSVLKPSSERSEKEKKNALSLIDRLLDDQINLQICQNYQELVTVLENSAQAEGSELREKVLRVLNKLKSSQREDVEEQLGAFPRVRELLAEQCNVLHILHMGLVEFVLEELRVFHQEQALVTAAAAAPGQQASCRHLLLALAELSAAQEGYRREIMARCGVEFLQTALRRGQTEDMAEAVRVILELASAPENRAVIQINGGLLTRLEDLKQRTDNPELAQLAQNVLRLLPGEDSQQGQEGQ